ncbi:hypothetical protein Plhal304r1_c001g0002081 [Plasmopara halstedii]
MMICHCIGYGRLAAFLILRLRNRIVSRTIIVSKKRIAPDASAVNQGQRYHSLLKD